MAMLRLIAPKLALSLLLGALLAYLAAKSGVPPLPPAGALEAVAPWAIPAYVASLLVTHTLRAARFRHLLAPVKRLPLGEIILLNWIGFFAIFALPLRLGELARPALTKLRHAVPISVGLGTVAVERVVDGLVSSLCVAWAIAALPRLATDDPIAASVPAIGAIAVVGFAAAFGALALFLWQRRLAEALTRRTLGLLSPSIASSFGGKVANIADGIRSIGEAGLLSRFSFETALYWASNAFGMWLLAVGCGLPAHLGHGIALMGVLALGILLPAGPGLFGSFQLALAAGLRLYFPESQVVAEGTTYIFLLYSIQAVVIVLTGALPLYLLDVRLAELLPRTGAHLPAESRVD